MAATIKPLVADRDGTFSLTVTYREANGTPIDMSGKDIAFWILARKANEDVLFTVDGTGDDQGVISVGVSDTSEWPAGMHSYRLIVDGEFLMIGSFKIRTPADV